LHWTTLFFILKLQEKRGESLKELGYKLQKIQTFRLLIIFLVVAFGMFGFVEWTLSQVSIDSEKIAELPSFIPITTGHRLLFILVVLSAGFCEEIIYRGYAITRGIELGLYKWVALVPAAISFVFIHGLAGYYFFWMYFIVGLIFGVIFVYSKRLLPNIVLHLFLDLLVMLTMLGSIEQ
jgi:hypothetical protein